MSTRGLTILLAVVVLLLSASWWARQHYGAKRCESFGKVFVPDKGCVDPQTPPPIILERGIKRT
jgi:hypothetical protein